MLALLSIPIQVGIQSGGIVIPAAGGATEAFAGREGCGGHRLDGDSYLLPVGEIGIAFEFDGVAMNDAVVCLGYICHW